MGRRVDTDKLVGAEEIAERLGLSSYQRVHELRRRHPDFPAPIVRLKRAMVWYWPDVERWARATGRSTQPHASPTSGRVRGRPQ